MILSVDSEFCCILALLAMYAPRDPARCASGARTPMPVAIPSRRSLSAVLAGNLTTFFRVEGCMEAMLELHLIYITLSFSAFGFCCSKKRDLRFLQCVPVRLWYHGKEVEAWVWGLWKHQEGDRCGHVMPVSTLKNSKLTSLKWHKNSTFPMKMRFPNFDAWNFKKFVFNKFNSAGLPW